MKLKKLVCLLLAALCAISLCACISQNNNESQTGNAPNVYPVVQPTENPAMLEWSASSYSTVHIVSVGLSPSSETVSFDFGFDTVMLKNKGYTKLNFSLEFDVYVDKGINVSTTVGVYFLNNCKSQFGAGWSYLEFTNTRPNSKHYNKTVRIENLLQQRGKLYLTFDAIDNTLFTGTYISNIEVTITAE